MRTPRVARTLPTDDAPAPAPRRTGPAGLASPALVAFGAAGALVVLALLGS
jgi:hypothetical protein